METDAVLLLSKSYVCPVCEKKFISKTVKTGKARLLRTEMDLRPVYQHIDPSKYEVIFCPVCGYAALEKYFDKLTNAQIALIQEKISRGFTERSNDEEFYTYEQAAERYKLALLSAMVKQADSSELGYICLKMSWLLQNKADWLRANDPENQEAVEKALAEAAGFSNKALEALSKARMEEAYPICGMNEPTLDYLLAALAFKDDQIDQARKMLSAVSSSREATERLKDKVYDLKTMIAERTKAN